MKIKVIACEVMKEEILGLDPVANRDYEFVSMDFHLYPQKLKAELQRIIDTSSDYQKIILAFGLCGGAAAGLRSTTSELIIPRVHDCIPIFLSSEKTCVCDFKKEMGTFYLSNGWMITEKTILSDYQRILDKFGQEKADRMQARMYDGYNKVLFIKTNAEPCESTLEQSRQIAELFKAEYVMVKGESCFIEKIIRGPWELPEFIKLPPSYELTEEAFGIGDGNIRNNSK